MCSTATWSLISCVLRRPYDSGRALPAPLPGGLRHIPFLLGSSCWLTFGQQSRAALPFCPVHPFPGATVLARLTSGTGLPTPGLSKSPGLAGIPANP